MDVLMTGEVSKKMKKIISAMLIIAMVLMVVACSMENSSVPEPNPGVDDNPGTMTEPETPTADEIKAFDSYMGAFGHVRVLGDIDHILKGEPVDDEPGVTVQSMVAGQISFDINRTELSMPLTLTAYDYDGHRNPEDADKHLYTRTATGKATLVLTGAVTADGTAFIATGYRVEDADIALDVDDSEYIYLELPAMELTADGISGIFTTQGGISRASVTVNLANGIPSGIADVHIPKFGNPEGSITINGKAVEL